MVVNVCLMGSFAVVSISENEGAEPASEFRFQLQCTNEISSFWTHIRGLTNANECKRENIFISILTKI